MDLCTHASPVLLSYCNHIGASSSSSSSSSSLSSFFSVGFAARPSLPRSIFLCNRYSQTRSSYLPHRYNITTCASDISTFVDVSSDAQQAWSPVGLCDTVVGVLGGGQLGRMLCQAASSMGIKVAVLDPERDCPASSVAYKQVVGSFRDTNAVRQFAKECGVLTVEIEHVDVETLEELEREGVDIEPKPITIRIIQDKYLQKVHFKQHGVALSEFKKIEDPQTAEEAGAVFGYPLMMKSRYLAYDGRGNAVVQSEDHLLQAVSLLGGFERGLYAEKWAPFVKELSIMVARGRDGSLNCFPIVETTHKENICHIVEAPAQISNQVADSAIQVAKAAVGSLKGAGIFGVELFLLSDGQVLLNEVAPRPHNSGHYTIEGCYCSQYEQHLRAVLGLPLGDSALKVPVAIMYNLLGEDDGEVGFAIAQEKMRKAINISGASVHWYGKSEIRKQRKMGHITVVGQAVDTVREKIKAIIGNEIPASWSLEDTSTKDLHGSQAQVGIIMGSDSDLPIMKAAAEVLETFDIAYDLTVVSAHRTPERMVEYAKNAHLNGIRVIIAGAGGAAHLPGMVAAMSPLPVIGVPVRGSSLDGLDSLLSIVQMPRGVPVATVAINNAMNAGLLAIRILSAFNDRLRKKILDHQNNMKDTVLEKAERLEEVGWQAYM